MTMAPLDGSDASTEIQKDLALKQRTFWRTAFIRPNTELSTNLLPPEKPSNLSLTGWFSAKRRQR
jgi:hypothetical protein